MNILGGMKITHLQLKKMSVIYQSAHVPITFQLLKMSSISTPNQTLSNIAQGTNFSRKNISHFTDLHIENNQTRKFRANGIVAVIGTHVNVYQILYTWQPYLRRDIFGVRAKISNIFWGC